jgi:hypothetical protein
MDDLTFDFSLDSSILGLDDEIAYLTPVFADDCLPPEAQYTSPGQLFEAI